MGRIGRKRYPKHKGDALDLFITDRCRGADGGFSFEKFRELMAALDCPAEFLPEGGNNGTKRMTAGLQLRSWFSDGVLKFKDGSTVKLDLEST